MEENSVGMARALAFSYVNQLPRTSCNEVRQQEVVYDRQILLNELWYSYCDRTDRPEWKPQDSLRDKWVIETWEEWLVRKKKQQGNIAAFFSEMAARGDMEAKKEREREVQSEKSILRIEKEEQIRQSKLLPKLHTLLVDFDEMRLKSEASARLNLEDDETKSRNEIKESEDPVLLSILQLEKEAFEIILLNIRDREAAEAAKLQEQEDKTNLQNARLAEEAAMEADKLKQQQEAKLETERQNAQEEKDRKVAERRARVMAEREKRRSKEELARTRRDSRRRSSAKIDSAIRDARRLDARNCRFDRQAVELEPFLERLKKRVSEVNSQEMIDKLLSDTTSELGLLLFDTAVYIAICSDDEQTLRYKYASDNCSELLKAGEEILDIPGNPTCPTVTCMKECKQNLLPNVLKQSEITIVRVGTKENDGEGDFMATPIVEAGGRVAAVVACDTIFALNQQQENLLQEESDCYVCDKQLPHVPITEDIENFFSKVTSILSEAYILGRTPDLSSCQQSTGSLYSAVTSSLSKLTVPPQNCYIATLSRLGGDTFQVVSQNGINISDKDYQTVTFPNDYRNVVGQQLDDGTAPSFGVKPDLEEHVLIENVSQDSKVIPYQPTKKGGSDITKKNEYLALFPIISCGGLIGVVGLEASSGSQLTEGLLRQIKQVVTQLSDYRGLLINFKMRHVFASQCVQWCAALSGCKHCYLSLRSDLVRKSTSDGLELANSYEYIAATESQSFVVGNVLRSGEGITHGVIESGVSAHHANVSKVSDPSIFFIKKSNSEGQLAVVPVGKIGAIYLDTVGWTEGKRDLTKPDIAMMENSAATLLKLLTELDEEGADAEDRSGTTLKIESEVNASCVRFLKRIWQDTTTALHSMEKEHLMEMSRYNKPPEAIPPVCSAAFIIMGKKPKAVATWDQTRKCIKHSVIEKMTNFDPTKTTPAKAFFIRAKKLTKGCTVDFVAKKGSVPASLFFNWTFVNIQLRYASIYFRKLHADGLLEVAEGSGPAEEKEEVPSEFGSSIGEAPTEDDPALEDGVDEEEDE